jgi:mannose-6-phosphate isomerase
MQADEGAEIIVGFDKKTDREAYKCAVSKGELIDLLHIEKTAEGDTFYIPTGRVHAIGAGVLLTEIQQTSDITYRIFDYNRIDNKTGKPRELHTVEAVDAIDFEVAESYKTAYQLLENKQNKLLTSPYFKTNILQINNRFKPDYTGLDSFIIFICVKGQFDIQYRNNSINCKIGETILIPASLKDLVLISDEATILEVSL